MNKIKKIISLDYGPAEKKIISEIKKESKNNDIEFKILDTQEDFIIDLKKELILVVKNKIFDFNDTYFFARFYGKNKKMSGILAYILKMQKRDFSFEFFNFVLPRTSKYFQALYFYFNKINQPRTIIGTEDSLKKNIKYIESEMFYPFVLKGNGSKGEMVKLVKNRKDIFDNLAEMPEKKKEVVIIQEEIKAEYDIRILFFKSEFLAAMKRSSEGFLNNFNQGGKVEEYIPTKKDLALAKKAIKKFGMDYLAVDIMHKDGKPVILEIQIGPWTHGSRKANKKLNLGKQIIDIILMRNKK